MKISEIQERLTQLQTTHGDVEVMFKDTEGDSVWNVETISGHVAEKDEYPKEWDMPAGFVFLLIESW